MVIIRNIRSREWPDHGEEGFEEPEIEAGSNFVSCSHNLVQNCCTVKSGISRDEEAVKDNHQSI